MRCYDDCEREGREAYRREPYSHDTYERLHDGLLNPGTCNRDFRDGYEAAERDARESRYEEEQNERAYSAASREADELDAMFMAELYERQHDAEMVRQHDEELARQYDAEMEAEQPE